MQNSKNPSWSTQYKLSYNGNTNLKPAGIPWQYTQEQLDEYKKCAEDPKHFIKSYCKIISIDAGLVPFRLHDYQEEMVDFFLGNRKALAILPRQMGKTTVAAACLLWYILFNSAKTVAVVANKASAARETLFRLQIMYENLPMWLQQGVTTWNKGNIILENDSQVFTAATTSSGLRSRSVAFLYIDEAAIIPNTIAEEFFTSTYPTIISGKTSKVLMTSTPMGYNHFWRWWSQAVSGVSDFAALEIKYTRHPDRDEKWAEEQKAILGELKFRQEILCAFLGSSLTLISPEAIGAQRHIEPIYQDMGLDVYHAPEPKHVYTIVVDPSEGVAADYSAFTVIDITEMPYKLVAKYRDNKISPLLYPNIIHKTATKYNQAFILGEINKAPQVMDILANELGYENVLYVGRGKNGQQLTISGTNAKPGVVTDKKVKRIGCSNFKDLVESNKLLIQDKDIISEMSTFIEKRNSYAADDGYNDDLVMCLVLFGWATNNGMFKDLTDVNIREKIFSEQARHIDETLVPFGSIDDGNTQEVTHEVFGGDVWFSDNSLNNGSSW